jgi:sterol desaturase/sphingolipid hydroxylase (fatty acid hydroxylase superfamily)
MMLLPWLAVPWLATGLLVGGDLPTRAEARVVAINWAVVVATALSLVDLRCAFKPAGGVRPLRMLPAALVDDLVFYGVHRTLHAVPWLFHNVHAVHHAPGLKPWGP